MSAEPLNLSREKRRAFRAGKFPEDIITKDMIREMTCTVECGPGTPNYKEFKVTEGMLFTNVPLSMSPPLEYCDHLLKINGIECTSKKQMQEVIWRAAKSKFAHYMVFTVRRIISCEKLDLRQLPSNAAVRTKYSSDPTVKPNSGYLYYKLVLIYFPRSKLGIGIKSYQNVVYVESADNTWGSTTRRFLYLGDAILKVDDVEIFDVKTADTSLRSGFQKNGLVTLIIERSAEQGASNFVRGVLQLEKTRRSGVVWPPDVLRICKERLALFEKNGFGPEPTPILKKGVKNYSSASRVTMIDDVDVKQIGNDSVLSKCLDKAPDPSDPSLYRN